MEDEEDDERNGQGGEDEDEGSDSGKPFADRFAKKWWWIDWPVRVREIYGCTLNEVFDLNVVEFLNLMCYIKDRNDMEVAQLKNKNTKYY